MKTNFSYLKTSEEGILQDLGYWAVTNPSPTKTAFLVQIQERYLIFKIKVYSPNFLKKVGNNDMAHTKKIILIFASAMTIIHNGNIFSIRSTECYKTATPTC